MSNNKELNAMPPPLSAEGLHQRYPSQGPPPGPPPASSYAPAHPVFQLQSSNTGLHQRYPSQGPPPGPQPVSSYESAAQPLGYQPPPAVCSYEPTRPPPGPPPVSSYAPAPPVLQQQSSNTNVVVVDQPSGPGPQPATVTFRPIAREKEYLGLTVIMMVLCFLHGNFPTFFFLIPALIFAYVAVDHNNAGNYESAKNCGNFALFFNILTLVQYVIFLLAGVVLVVFYLVPLPPPRNNP